MFLQYKDLSLLSSQCSKLHNLLVRHKIYEHFTCFPEFAVCLEQKTTD